MSLEHEPDGMEPRVIVWVAGVVYTLVLLAGLVWRRLAAGSWVPAGLPGADPAISVAAGLGLAAGVIALTPVLSARSRWIRWVSLEMRKVLGPVSRRTALFLAIFSGIGEEVFFRGAMQAELGYVVTSLLFGLLHTGPGRRFLAWTAFAVVMGFLLGALFELTDCLLGPIVAHGTINYFNLLRIGRLDPPAAEDMTDLEWAQ